MKKSLTQLITGVGVVSSGLVPSLAHADFIKDSSGTLDLKNYYFNRDYREAASQSMRAEWAQGFILGIKSGFTEGTVGFGLDLTGMLGVKLDSSPGLSGTGLLQRDSDKNVSDEYSKLGVTAKARFAKSNLKITLGQIDQAKDRDSTNYEDMKLTTVSKVYKSTALSDQFRFAGGDYSLTPNTLLSYHFAALDSIYQQQYVGFKNNFGLGPGTLKTDVRYFKSDKDGAGLAGKVDNSALSSRLTYQYGGHSIGGGFQQQYGTTPFTYLDGSITYLFTEYQFSNFTQTRERAWHARYDYNFADLGLPGLLFGIKYAKGDSAEVLGFNREGREWERDLDLGYVVQNGPFKGVSMRWRNALSKGNYFNDVNENRVMLGYTLALW
jgi:hypothetical protein